jgi:single-strand DNA-binding protein
MANLNKVMLIGRLTADPEVRTFANGGKVAKIRFAVNNRKKNQQSGQWEDVPMFIDCEVYNRGENGRQADLAEQYLSKGRQVFFEGRLELDQWDDKTTGAKRSKHKLVIENMQFLDGGQRGEDGAERPARTGAPSRPAAQPPAYTEGGFGDEPDAGGGKDSEIPF